MSNKKHKREKIDITIDNLKLLGLFDIFEKYELCGSYRRKKDMIGDLDIVAICDVNLLEEFAKDNNILLKTSPFGKNFLLEDVQVDIFFANKNNFYLNVLFWTGPYHSNTRLVAKYYSKGYRLTQKMISSLSSKIKLTDKFYFDEERIFSFIGEDYVPPEKRG